MENEAKWRKSKIADKMVVLRRLKASNSERWNEVFNKMEDIYLKKRVRYISGKHQVRYRFTNPKGYDKLIELERKYSKIGEFIGKKLKEYEDDEFYGHDDIEFECMCEFNRQMEEEGK